LVDATPEIDLKAICQLLTSSLCVVSSRDGRSPPSATEPTTEDESAAESICASEPAAGDKSTTESAPPKADLVNIVAIAN
jgi:hypothetical protein